MQASECEEVFNSFCHADGYIEPAKLQDALVDYCWGDTSPTVDNSLCLANVSLASFRKLSKNHAKASFNGVLDKLDERDQAILVLTREHVRLQPPVNHAELRVLQDRLVECSKLIEVSDAWARVTGLEEVAATQPEANDSSTLTC